MEEEKIEKEIKEIETEMKKAIKEGNFASVDIGLIKPKITNDLFNMACITLINLSSFSILLYILS